jgi:DNA-binding transcriptional MerR regulator
MAVQSAAGEHTINDLAKRLKISAKTLKKWEQEKKIPEARRNPFGWRLYTEHEMTRIEKLVKENGFFVKPDGKPKQA